MNEASTTSSTKHECFRSSVTDIVPLPMKAVGHSNNEPKEETGTSNTSHLSDAAKSDGKSMCQGESSCHIKDNSLLEGCYPKEVKPAIPMSKNQLKRQMRRDKWIETKDERRKVEREKRKMKRKLQYQEFTKQVQEHGIATFSRATTRMCESKNKFRIVIDMNFEDYMTDHEIFKATQQLGRIYSINRRSQNPCQLYVSSLKGKIRDRCAISNTGYINWDINCSELDYIELFSKACDDDGKSTFSAQQFVYLSGDADENLPEVDKILEDESKIYVIGGLVDHNRHKNLCYRLASERNIPTAKLPIKEHVNLCQRAILSTVTVFEVLLQIFGERKQWTETLLTTIPKRKLASTQPNSTTNSEESHIKSDNHEEAIVQKE